MEIQVLEAGVLQDQQDVRVQLQQDPRRRLWRLLVVPSVPADVVVGIA
jgi:hypothetical protein